MTGTSKQEVPVEYREYIYIAIALFVVVVVLGFLTLM